MKTFIDLDNLKCGGCATSIKEVVLEVSGVSKVDVLVNEGRIIIHHPEAIDIIAVKAKLRNLGYPEKGSVHGIEKLGLNAKSYVSCVIGRVTKNKESK